MVIGDLNPIQDSLEQLPRENGSEMIPSLEVEANQDLRADLGMIAGRKITTGMIAGRAITSGTAANLRKTKERSVKESRSDRER